jgi:thioredoxin reductase (NADPH)
MVSSADNAGFRMDGHQEGVGTLYPGRRDQVFPKLTGAQIARFGVHGRRLHLLVRSNALAGSMSKYLLERIERSANITLHTHTEIIAVQGEAFVERVIWRNKSCVSPETHAVGHVFLMTGAVPSSHWARGRLAWHEAGFILTGADVKPAADDGLDWIESEPPQSYETNLPGIFAVGDVRYGSVKRVAAAVGEGSACVQQVHASLQREKLTSQS